MNRIIPCLAFSIALIPNVANAIPYQGNNIYKVGNSALIVSTNPGNIVRFVFYDAKITKLNRTANVCGVASFILPNPLPASNYLVIDNLAYDIAATPTSTLPACNANGQLAEPRPNNFIANGRYHIVGKTPNSVVQIEYANHVRSTKAANNCGFISLRGNSNFDLGMVGNFDIEFNGFPKQTLNFGDLPTVINDSSPACRRINGNYVPYVPTDW